MKKFKLAVISHFLCRVYDLIQRSILLITTYSLLNSDLGLSNTIKCEGLSQDLLNTQCGSPAYAAPELLSNKKYGPKVDVWSM